jgi:hypothetical protein
LISAATPVSPLPALLLMMVRSPTPRSISASISSSGMPAVPKPPIITDAPSPISATAARTEATDLSITAILPQRACTGTAWAALRAQ